MTLADRFAHACFGAIAGALLGVLGWWLYGLAHSMAYDGPGMDPVLRHWLAWSAAAFGCAGAVFGPVAGGMVGDALNAIFHFETQQPAGEPRAGKVFHGVLLVLLLAAVWFTTPH